MANSSRVLGNLAGLRERLACKMVVHGREQLHGARDIADAGGDVVSGMITAWDEAASVASGVSR